MKPVVTRCIHTGGWYALVDVLQWHLANTEPASLGFRTGHRYAYGFPPGPAGWDSAVRVANRAAREAPRVLNYGDPEPDHSTKWLDSVGDIIAHNGEGWTWKHRAVPCDNVPFPWPLPRGWYPLTEVTDR